MEHGIANKSRNLLNRTNHKLNGRKKIFKKKKGKKVQQQKAINFALCSGGDGGGPVKLAGIGRRDSFPSLPEIASSLPCWSGKWPNN